MSTLVLKWFFAFLGMYGSLWIMSLSEANLQVVLREVFNMDSLVITHNKRHKMQPLQNIFPSGYCFVFAS